MNTTTQEPEYKITRREIPVTTEDGRDLVLTIETTSRGGFNSKEMKAWIPPYKSRKVVLCDGKPVNFENEADIRVNCIYMHYDRSAKMQYFTRRDNTPQKQAAADEFEACAQSPAYAEQSYLESIGVYDE